MPTPYKYAVIRVVPRVDRDEFINAGVIFFHPEQGFLGARTMLSEEKLRALSSRVDMEQVKRHLHGIVRICEGDADAGPIAKMKKSDRFHWLTSPRSTMIQTSAVKMGMADSPESELESLTAELVA